MYIGYRTTAMSIKERIDADLKKAMLEKDAVARDALRMVKTDLGRVEVDKGEEVSDADAIKVLQKAVKSRTESIEAYEEAGRADSAQQERAEIEVIQRYLPRQLDEAETRAAVQAIVDEQGLSEKKDMGRLMKELRARHGGTVDNKLASKIAGELLG